MSTSYSLAKAQFCHTFNQNLVLLFGAFAHALSKNNPENWLGMLPLLEVKHKASCTLKFAKQNISQTSTMKTTDARMTSNAIKTPIQPMSKNTEHKCLQVDWMEKLPLIEGKPKSQPVQRPNNISCPESYKNDNFFLRSIGKNGHV
jgi:hypothetical protein